ncbi:MAG: N-acetyltransferase [Actinobacteria bacterium]|nr:N-acetyltransferase [Actinomycetota bacterium]
MSDLGLPVAIPPNNGTLLRPLEESGAQDVVARLHDFFSPNPGGGYQLWSLWPGADLGPSGFESFTSPCMIRAAGGEPRPAPKEIRIVEADDADRMRDVEALWIENFQIEGAVPGTVCDERALDAWRFWIGYVDGRPVSTSAAFASDDFVGVYAVATMPEARGRGYGEALTWAATISDSSLPAALQASSMGRPVYERMGYRTVTEFTIWEKSKR